MTGGRLVLVTTIVASAACADAGVWQEPGGGSTSACTVASPIARIDGAGEASGAVASRRTPGVVWTHNDSGEPILIAVDTRGAVIGRVRVTGAQVDDWEDLAIGPCPQGTCVYIGDIGDNRGRRDRITVYRVPEPSPDMTATPPAEAFHAAYPDGAHDAESLFVTPEARLFAITKGDPGPVALYRFPHPLQSVSVMRLERVGAPLGEGNVARHDRPTGADTSSDGRWVAVRTIAWLAFYRTADLTSGQWRAAARADLSGVGERRGEGVAFGPDGTVFLVGEGGRDGGTFARLRCTLPQ